MTPERPSRDDNETTTDRPEVRCPICGRCFTPNRRQAYCTNACRQTAWRRRRTLPAAPVPVSTNSRRHRTIYTCIDCDTRYLGEQWCRDCNRPCRRAGPGGECPHCGDLLTVEELLRGDAMA